MKNQLKVLCLLLLFLFLIIVFAKNTYAMEDDSLTNATRAYFNSEVTKSYGNSDCILLENYDSFGNKIYGLIDSGRKITKNDANGEKSTVVKEFLKQHGVEELEFLAITHSHWDHNGDALTILDNFKVKTIYMKEYDEKWSPDGTQGTYEDIIERAVAKNIKVVGVSFLSLTSNEVSPSRSSDFIKNTKDAKESLFEAFYYNNNDDTNVIFNFGSATIQIFNWEMFDEEGNQYITGVTTNTTREIDASENNNSITFLLTQGTKKAFFASDMNNLDEDEATGRIGDEDRLKDAIGKVDFLKLGHHGYQYSNTEDYINVLNPEYAVITNDIGVVYKDTLNWLKDHNTDYLYTTTDEYAISATITTDEIYLGFETTGSFKDINNTLYYIPEGEKYKYVNYKNVVYSIEYQEKNIDVSSWNELKEAIDSNKNEIANIDNNRRVCKLYRLILNLKSDGDWTATEPITVDQQQEVVLTTSENITALRGIDLKASPLFLVKGKLNIGNIDPVGTIKLDGNKDQVQASSTLINIETGTLNLYNNTTLCNNMNETTERTQNATMQDYTSFGSAIYSKSGIINIYGGNITNNSQDVVLTNTLPKEINNNYRYSSLGTGIYMTNSSILNMYDGTISNNKAQNHSIVNTDENYTNAKTQRSITQTCAGVGIYANSNAEVNLLGGEISNNFAVNNSSITLKTATDKTIKTNVYSVNTGIYGVGIDVEGGKLKISNNFLLSGNSAELNSIMTLENNSSADSGIRGLQGHINNTDVIIDGAEVSNGNLSNNTKIIGTTDKSSVSTLNVGGGFDFINAKTFNVNNLTINNCNSGNGAGLYIKSSEGTISNSSFTNNESTSNGGGIYLTSANIKVNNVTIDNNKANYGGGLYVAGASSNAKLNDVTVKNNQSIIGSGGGIYAYGNINISGDNTIISHNNANTYGGGIMIKTTGIINAGEISNNIASNNAGGGVRVDGTLIMNGGIIKNNSAKTTGGGVDFTNGKFTFNGGQIQDNIATTAGNEIYPSDKVDRDLINPTIEIGDFIKEWTNNYIIINIIAEDESGIKSVMVGEQTILAENGVYSYMVTENGTYEVIATDNAGNKSRKEFTITCIDKEKPEITGASNEAIYNEEVIINATDALSGIKSVKLTKDDKEIEYLLGDKLTNSGKYVLTIEDYASNISTINFTIDRSLKNDEIIISGLSKEWSNKNQVITITINNEIKNIKINGEEITLVNGTYNLTVSENQSYVIEIVDLDGNTSTKTIEVFNIDKNPPNIYGVINENVYDEKVNLTIRDEESGISSIKIIRDNYETAYTENEIELQESGKYQVKVIDNAGNETVANFTIKINNEVKDEDKNGGSEIINGEINDEIMKNEDGGIQENYEDEKDNTTIQNSVLPQTGNEFIIIYFLVIFMILIICFIKLKNYKDIK